MLGLPIPLGAALVLSYAAVAMVTTVLVVLRRSIGRDALRLLWAALAVGVTSVALRTAYYATE